MTYSCSSWKSWRIVRPRPSMGSAENGPWTARGRSGAVRRCVLANWNSFNKGIDVSINWVEVRTKLLGPERKKLLPPKIKIPALPKAVTEFCRKAEDPNQSAVQLGKIIETDSGLTCELLKFANSARFALRVRAASAHQAISLLGVRQTKLLLISLSVQMATAARESKLINAKRFWNINLERAFAARETAFLMKADVDLAFAGGMLQDFLLPTLTTELCDVYTAFIEQQRANHVPIVEWERQQLGWTHAEAAGHIMWDWGFPDDLLCTVALHHHGLPLLCDPVLGSSAAAATAVSALVPDSLGQVPDSFSQLLHLDSVWPAFKLPELAQRVANAFEGESNGQPHDFGLRAIWDRHEAQTQKAAAAKAGAPAGSTKPSEPAAVAPSSK